MDTRIAHTSRLRCVTPLTSAGACNIALLSYVRDTSVAAVTPSQWSIVAAVGLQLIIGCVKSNFQGGTATVNGTSLVSFSVRKEELML